MTDANRFEPAELTVPKGSTVTWINKGQAVHTATDDPSKAINKSNAVLPIGAQPFDSGSVPAGASYSHTFDVPGEYTYFCIPHESLGMVGHITVTD
jgi:plastocyanin